MKNLEKYLKTNIESEKLFVESILEHEKTFQQLYKVCGNRFNKGTGSYLFDGQKYEYCDKMFEKQLLLFNKSKEVKSVLEIGTYMGHSLLIMLIGNPQLKITSIDIEDTYSYPSIKLLESVFNTEINFIKGNSIDVISSITDKFDLFHIDGTHKIDFVKKEYELCKPLSSTPTMQVIFDDYDTITEINNHIIKESIILEQTTPKCDWRNSYLKIKI
jgi:predicted O-methyltransferase YrrM